MTLTVAAYLDRIRADATAIAGIVRSHGLDTSVEHCPGWTVGDAVQHLGEVHRWATEIVRTGEVATMDEQPHLGQADVLAAWFEDGAAALCDTLESVDPERECWTFGFPPANAGFWARRQAHETVVHHLDVALAVGAPFELSPELAGDGVGEVVDFMFPRQVALGRTPPLPARITLRATDSGASWVLGESGPEVELRGPSLALLCMVWRRPHAPLARDGDPAAFAALDAAVLVP